MFLVQFQGISKALTQFWQEGQRTTQEGYIPFNLMAASQASNGLINDRLEYGLSNIFMGSPLIQESLYVRLGKYTATRGNRIQGIRLFSQFIKARCIRLQKGSHLVDKGSRTTSTRSIHPVFCLLAQVSYLGIFPAQFNDDICLWVKGFNRPRFSDNFLNKRNFNLISHSHPARPGNCYVNMIMFMAHHGLF